MKQSSKIYVDIDGTICNTPNIDGKWEYRKSTPIQQNIDKINNLYDKGSEIIYWTARGSNSGIDWYGFTIGQLNNWGCKFHKLICGKQKGSFDLVIDDKAKRIEEIAPYKIGFTCSAFDVIHPGHILMLRDCKNVCDYLVVGLQLDPTIDRKEKNKPIQTLEERKIMIESIKYVDEVIVYNTEDDLIKLIKKINPDIRILGSDWKEKPFTGKNLGIPVYFHTRDHNWSSTNFRKRISNAHKY